MFSRILTGKSTPGFSEMLERLKNALDQADAVVVGAGAGLSTEPHPVKRTEKKYKDFPVGSQELPAAFQAARQRACFSKGVRTPRLR